MLDKSKLSLIAIMILLISCSGPPTYVNRFPKYNLSHDEDELWHKASQQVAKLSRMGKFERDVQIDRVIDTLLSEFLSPASLSHFPIQTKILYSSEPNAMAFGNGTVAVSLGMVAFCKNMDMLACIIGHEAAHLNNRDALAYYKKVKEQDTGLIVGTLVPGLDILVTVSTAHLLAGFGREKEQTADIYAVETMLIFGYDSKQSIEVIKLFRELSKFHPTNKHTFLASHPTYEARIEQMSQLINKKGQNFPVQSRTISTINYNFLAASSRKKVCKLLIQEKKYDLCRYLLDNYPHKGWHAEAILSEAELLLATKDDTTSLVDSVKIILSEIKEPEKVPEYYKIEGLALYRTRRLAEAKATLERYLSLSEKPKDRLYIEGLIEGCRTDEK